MPRVAVPLAVLALLVVSGCTLRTVGTEQRKTAGPAPAAVQRAYNLDADFYDRSYQNNTAPVAPSAVIGGTVPHHLLASHLLAAFFEGLAPQQPSIIVLVGPNHLGYGSTDITTSRLAWQTTGGELQPALEVIDILVNSGVAVVDERLFSEEHSISGPMGFVGYSLPRSRVVAIALKERVTETTAQTLAEVLNRVLPADAVVVASTDFSHTVTSPVADAQDAVSIQVLEAMGTGRMSEVHVDSPASRYTLLYFLKLRAATHGQLLTSSNAAKLTATPQMADVTSYITMYYTK
ncbi:MAG: AmmeMemoRadiSam system protein B [Patescibacteria group bacterium]